MCTHTEMSVEDQAFVECLRKLAEVRQGEPLTDDERFSLSLLINTFDTAQAGPEFAEALADILAEGLTLQEVREVLAEDAGIIDYAQLYFFATIDVRLAKGELKTIDVTDLSDDELLGLMSPD